MTLGWPRAGRRHPQLSRGPANRPDFAQVFFGLQKPARRGRAPALPPGAAGIAQKPGAQRESELKIENHFNAANQPIGRLGAGPDHPAPTGPTPRHAGRPGVRGGLVY
ncbi:MAG: hypothetical protein WKG07_42605 [Hymenobacter sp.]